MRTTSARLPQRVAIREVGPRDGLQLEAPLSLTQKINLITDASVGELDGCPFAPGATGIDLDTVRESARRAQQRIGHRLDSAVLRAGGRSRPLGRDRSVDVLLPA